MKNIIHISDLHLSAVENRGFYYKDAIKVVDCLLLDLKEIEDSRSIKFDTIFFTGDLVNSGSKEEYTIF
ncbi:metallophosphoesterase, partial [Pantoea eucalypti]